MEAPSTLNGYFTVVDDFFKKTFRDDALLFVAVKTQQYAESVPGAPILSSTSPDSVGVQTDPPVVVDHTSTAVAPKSAPRTANSVVFSPRMVLNRDGTALGKVKLTCGVDVPRVCRLEQGLLLNSAGVVAAQGKVRDVLDGLVLTGRVAVNTIAPASQDVTSVSAKYERSDFYSSVGYQRNGLGSSNLLVDCGTSFLNLLAGAGFERQRVSYLEQRDGPEQYDVMYAGVGFTGVNLSMAAKMTRSSDAWSSARVAVLQRLSPSTTVACAYSFDLVESRANVSIGFTQGFRVCLPAFVLPKRTPPTTTAAPAVSTGIASTVVPFVGACKAQSDGQCAVTIRGLFNNAVRWGVVAQRNVLKAGSPVQYGVTLSLEAEA